MGRLLDTFIGRVDILVHGGAKGADTAAGWWAEEHGVHTAVVRPYWARGKAAGMIRNRAMLYLKPDYCMAFPGGPGTAGMVALCREHGVTVEVVA